MIELGISKNFGEKKFFFCPRFGIGNAVVDIKTVSYTHLDDGQKIETLPLIITK